MDIGSKHGYPSSSLSNFAGHRFTLDDVEIHSMEGWLQGLKFKNPDMQVEVCKLVGYGAKKRGSKKNWKQEGLMYWRGEPIDRFGDEYQVLLDRAYKAMFEQSKSFRKALMSTKDAVLTHSIGRRKESETILTKTEFCRRLMDLRANAQNIDELFE
jgi:predicted NAD-dependent protein-ADP-ribosyltransferase YbiA (DUF1768 family)